MKERHIRYSGKALGRPSKTAQSPQQKRKSKKEQGERNHIEGKFGQGKNGYNLDQVRARKAQTSASWIGCILFVMNLIIPHMRDFFGPFLFYYQQRATV